MIDIYGIKLYETEELAKLLNVSPHAITTLRKKGLMRYTRIGKKLYTSEDSLLAYLHGYLDEPPRKTGEQADKGTKNEE